MFRRKLSSFFDDPRVVLLVEAAMRDDKQGVERAIVESPQVGTCGRVAPTW